MYVYICVCVYIYGIFCDWWLLSLSMFSRFVYAIAHVRAHVWAILCCVVWDTFLRWSTSTLWSLWRTLIWMSRSKALYWPCLRFAWNAPGVCAGSHSTWRLLDFAWGYRPFYPSSNPEGSKFSTSFACSCLPSKTNKQADRITFTCLYLCLWVGRGQFSGVGFLNRRVQVWWQIPLAAEPSRQSRCLFRFRQYKQSLPP